MLPKFPTINAVTRIERHETIVRVRDAILKCGGFILDFHLFSNISICFNFELPVRNVEALCNLLGEANVQLSRESRETLARWAIETAQLSEAATESEVAGTLQITFVHNEPDLRIEVPPIPG